MPGAKKSMGAVKKNAGSKKPTTPKPKAAAKGKAAKAKAKAKPSPSSSTGSKARPTSQAKASSSSSRPTSSAIRSIDTLSLIHKTDVPFRNFVWRQKKIEFYEVRHTFGVLEGSLYCRMRDVNDFGKARQADETDLFLDEDGDLSNVKFRNVRIFDDADPKKETFKVVKRAPKNVFADNKRVVFYGKNEESLRRKVERVLHEPENSLDVFLGDLELWRHSDFESMKDFYSKSDNRGKSNVYEQSAGGGEGSGASGASGAAGSAPMDVDMQSETRFVPGPANSMPASSSSSAPSHQAASSSSGFPAPLAPERKLLPCLERLTVDDAATALGLDREKLQSQIRESRGSTGWKDRVLGELKQAWRKRTMACHPDKAEWKAEWKEEEQEGSQDFHKTQEAYRVLQNWVNREAEKIL